MIDNGRASITIRDFSENEVDELLEAIAFCHQVEQPVLQVWINSGGGDCGNLCALIDAIEAAKEHGLTVATCAVGKAMSCGAVLLAAGTPGFRFAGANTELLIHPPSSFIPEFEGGEHDAQDHLRSLMRYDKRIFDMLAKYTGTKASELRKQCNRLPTRDWWLGARLAKRIGLIDRIGVPIYKTASRTSHGLA